MIYKNHLYEALGQLKKGELKGSRTLTDLNKGGFLLPLSLALLINLS